MSDTQVMQPERESIFSGYVPAESSYDEIFSRPGQVREGWREFLAVVEQIGRPELTRRWLQAQREMQETGIAYSIYDHAGGVSRPWELDLMPQLFAADEWGTIVAGLQQRAMLLNRIIADLYGPQELLSAGLIPPEWLFAHPGFRRVFHGQEPPAGTFLHFYAADLARASDGRWWVVADRTDAPLGIGYALENRVATSRMLPNIMQDLNVERLASFFMTVHATLRGLAPAHQDNPRVVLLSHGPKGPNFFEDAYLARYLGYTLVESGDLAVRGDRVYMKTLAGLLPIDVILRRMSDELCDPMELRTEAGLGIPGLLQAARLGHVAVVNALGSSLIESPSLMPFLPGVARHLWGDDLRLPSVATWWCGQAEARAHVAALLQRQPRGPIALRSAFRVARLDALSGELLRQQTSLELLNLLRTRPSELVAQETVQRSTSPVWCDDSPARWQLGMRVYLVASQDSYQVLPGGLVRLAHEPRELESSILHGQVCKDVWVQAAGPVAQVSLMSAGKQNVVLRRSGVELSSRVADNFFWLGRHAERAQGMCRLLRAVMKRLTGEFEAEPAQDLPCLIRCLAEQGQIEPGFVVEGLRDELPELANVLPAIVLDEKQPGNLRASVISAYHNASLVRDRLSLDSWRIVHRLEMQLAEASERVSLVQSPFGLVELDELLDELIVSMAAIDGLIGESMTRTPGWRFLELGRRLERSLHIVSLVQSLPKSPLPDESRMLEAMLEVADSLMTYRSRYLAMVHRAGTLDLLITDETNPRSLAYQLAAIAEHVRKLPGDESQPLGAPEERISSSLLYGVRMMDVDDLNATGERTKLGRLLLRIAEQLPKLSELVSHRYLIHAGRPRQMTEARRAL